MSSYTFLPILHVVSVYVQYVDNLPLHDFVAEGWLGGKHTNNEIENIQKKGQKHK